MKFLICIFLLFTSGECQNCPAGYEPIEDGCFKAINAGTASWDGAQELCGKVDGYLAIINSCTLLGSLVRFFHFTDSESTAGYWIGARDIDNEGTWLWTDGNPVPLGAPFWGTTGADWKPEPSGESGENCAQLSPSDRYYFHDEICTKSSNPLCQADPISTKDDTEGGERSCGEKGLKFEALADTICPDGFVNISGSCFHFHYVPNNGSTKTTWQRAASICNDFYDGSHLAVIDTCDLFKDLVDFIGENDEYQLVGDSSYWIGGTDENQEGHWTWVNLLPMAMGPPIWGSSNGVPEPSGGDVQNCVHLYQNDRYYFHDGECTLGAYPICQTDPIV